MSASASASGPKVGCRRGWARGRIASIMVGMERGRLTRYGREERKAAFQTDFVGHVDIAHQKKYHSICSVYKSFRHMCKRRGVRVKLDSLTPSG